MTLPSVLLLLAADSRKKRAEAAVNMECMASAMSAAWGGGESAKAMREFKAKLLSDHDAEQQGQGGDGFADVASTLAAAGAIIK